VVHAVHEALDSLVVGGDEGVVLKYARALAPVEHSTKGDVEVGYGVGGEDMREGGEDELVCLLIGGVEVSAGSHEYDDGLKGLEPIVLVHLTDEPWGSVVCTEEIPEGDGSAALGEEREKGGQEPRRPQDPARDEEEEDEGEQRGLM
jgi:hypothetical protein